MGTYKLKLPPSDYPAEHGSQHKHVFAQPAVTLLRNAVEQAVYGNIETDKSNDPKREETISALATLGQMGELTEMDLDEAKKGYL
ncbi:hypothetical protein HNV11_16045 [Spirosoma taeanense]|uniref:Uncharacterized protein n=1 Tax=Spirosoma taeanense TaxID=2735870 RepID=A0A6M5YCU2_9BACT|nr:hypothetical protein [Spirosoma taeanense]QJW90782.1 hypothetical protein HNV11_16045 [Spirosoma taeanense]